MIRYLSSRHNPHTDEDDKRETAYSHLTDPNHRRKQNYKEARSEKSELLIIIIYSLFYPSTIPSP